jgi:coenzyme A diphosphatase NUDT7
MYLQYLADSGYRAIMIRTATIGFAQYPLFELESPSQPSMSERIAWVLANSEVFRKAARDEGIDVDRALLALQKKRRQKSVKRTEKGKREKARL